MDQVSIIGDEPALIGQKCQELVALEFSYQGEVVEPANVIFLKFNNQWFRLYFDNGIVFWESDAEDPHTKNTEEEEPNPFRAIDLTDSFQLKDRCLKAIHYQSLPQGSQVKLEFDDKKEITFQCLDDTTTYF